MSNLRASVRAVTLLVVEVVFVGLMIKIVIDTWTAEAGQAPDLPSVQVAAAGALAVALGAGYATLLGVPATTNDNPGNSVRATLQSAFSERTFLATGVLAYMLAGFAACITYGLNESETPEVLRTIAVAFGGYVIAFVGSAMRQVSD